MNSIDKIDEVLKFIIQCENPPKINFVDIYKLFNANKIDLSAKENIEIADKLVKDKYVIKEIENNKIYYYSSFEGRLFFQKGGYKSQYKYHKRKRIYDISMTVITIINIFAIIALTFLIYRATNKANDNRDENNKLNSKIEHLTKSRDSLINVYKIIPVKLKK